MNRDELFGNIEGINVESVSGDLSPLELMTLALGAIVSTTINKGLRIKRAAVEQFVNDDSAMLMINTDDATGDLLVRLTKEVPTDAKN